MNYYHFTSKRHWKEIQESGYITTTDSNLFPTDMETFQIIDGKARDKNYDYRKVVWLTNKIRPSASEMGLAGAAESKTAVRITISSDKVGGIIKWKHFADSANMDPEWRRQFTHGYNSSSWYVVEHDIPLDCISSVDILE